MEIPIFFPFQQQPAVERNDSNESNDSLGDIPIELRHLEGDFYDEELSSGSSPEDQQQLQRQLSGGDDSGSSSVRAAAYFNSEVLKANIMSLFGAGGHGIPEGDVATDKIHNRAAGNQLLGESKSKSLDDLIGM